MIRSTLGEVRLTVPDAGTAGEPEAAVFGVVPEPSKSRPREPDAKCRIGPARNVLPVVDGRRGRLEARARAEED